MSTTSSAASATSPRQSQSRKKTKPTKKRLTAKAREKLIDTYLPLVRQMADRVHRRLPRHRIELDSLTQSGVVGLLEAAQRYDEGRGVAFQDYARHRIYGEIMEYLRSLDWASRSVRSWGRKMSSAKINLAARLGRDADPQEVASELGVSLKEYYQVDQSVNEATLLNLEDLALASNEGIAKPTQEQSMLSLFQDPQTIFENKDLIEKLSAAIEKLPDQERLVVTLSYYEGLTLREVGELWQLTEGRICQIRTRAIERLRKAIQTGIPTEEPDIVLPLREAA